MTAESTAGRRSARIALDAALVAIVLALVAIALAQSWNRWFDPIVDAGRDLYIADRLAHGAELYRDIRYQYPPLAPYFLALVVRIAGSSLAAFAAIGVAVSLATVALLASAANRLAGRWAAFTIAVTFVSLNFTGATTFGSNFVIPYSYAATIGMLFLLLFFVAAIAGKRPWLRAVAIVAGLAASWCKIEYAAAVVIVMAALLLCRRLRMRDAAVFVLLLVVSLFGASAFFGGSGWLSDNVFSASLTRGAAAQRFFATVAGTASWPSRTIDVLAGCAAAGLIVLMLRIRRLRWAAVVAAILIGTLFPVNSFFRAWGLLQWVALVWAVLRDRRDVLLPLAALSIASTLRIPLNVAPWWYGFVLIAPVYLLIVYVLFSYLPARGAYERQWVSVWVVVFVLFGVRGLADQRVRYSVKEFPVHTVRGTYFDANADRAAVLEQVLPRLRGETLAVFPEGIGLNYLAAARTPLTWYTFIPPETADRGVEDRVIRELGLRPPQRVAFVKRSVVEFGYRGFGEDYDARLAQWIRSRYVVEQSWATARFQLVLMRRAPRPLP